VRIDDIDLPLILVALVGPYPTIEPARSAWAFKVAHLRFTSIGHAGLTRGATGYDVSKIMVIGNNQDAQKV